MSANHLLDKKGETITQGDYVSIKSRGGHREGEVRILVARYHSRCLQFIYSLGRQDCYRRRRGSGRKGRGPAQGKLPPITTLPVAFMI